MEAESYADPGVSSYINENFIPLSVHIKENPRNFHRFEAVWTPTIIIADPNGKERWRLEGYLPKEEFAANIQMGRARVAAMDKDWSEAERRYEAFIAEHPDSKYVPEATYWRGVSLYQKTHEHEALSDVAKTFNEKYRDSVWALRSIPWRHD